MFDTLEADIVVLQETKIQKKDLRDDMVLVPGWDCYFSLPKHEKGNGLTVPLTILSCNMLILHDKANSVSLSILASLPVRPFELKKESLVSCVRPIPPQASQSSQKISRSEVIRPWPKYLMLRTVRNLLAIS